ncbi:uncharacterized protein BO97DRAFT_428529 [Aspergillus homomorphus CBS 101889]|uniref:Uncharacterized protein n=1 Tax=Aspergillus homomorphus (strain CBS 101889) TaxID=1450537 RepID=A0A395HLA8_ASPHC|nr:hypothetical protein BO97DRAFT_428529 [Aspergillus homomorphus CBS 101889]RAL08223.1 hypothetical protein BO97DRAFT_428529 [Aspergillus homomorphus CBS 101889]
MPTSTLSTLKTKRVGFADPLTSSPGRSNTNTNTHKDATEDKEKRNVDAKDSVTYKGMPLSATELLHALHSSIVDEILSDEVSRHSTPFEDYSHSPDWSQRQTEQGLSSPDWEMGDPIIPQPWLAASTADESMSESDSDSEPGFASALQSQTQTQVPANNSTSVMEVEFTEVAEKSAPCAAIESIDLVKSPTPEPQPYFDAREHTASQSLAAAAEDSCSEFEFDSDCEDDYHQFPSVSREPVRNLGFELCAAEFMRKGVYPVKRMEKRAFVDYASQKAMEIGMTEEEFARMMRALRGVYLLQWGEKMRKDSEGISTEKSDANPVHGPEVSQVEPVGRRRKESELMSAESGAVQPDVTPGTLQPVLIEESEAESAENSKVTAADGSQKDSATPLDQVALDPPSISASASNLDAASPPKTPVKHEPTQMSTMQTDQEEKANDKGTRIKADKKTKAPVDNSSANEKKRKHDGSPIILDQDQQANTVLTQKRKQRKKARLSSESHPSSDPVVKLSVQSSETARQQNKLPNKTTKDMPGNTSIQNSASQGKQANELAKAGGLGCAKHFTTEPLRDAKNLEKSQQLKEGTTPAKSVLPRNATKGDNLKKPAGPKPMEASKPSDSKPSKESCGVQKGGDSKVITKPKRSKGRQDTSNAADVIDLTGAELQRSMDKKPNKDFKPQSDFSASFPQQSMLKSKQAKSRQANARSNPSTPRIARKPKKADATDFPTPMIRKGQQQPPAMRYGPYTS